MKLRMFGATDKGLVRSNNQDAYYCNAEYGVAIVSDGMGGHKGGEVASELVVEGLRDAFLEERSLLSDEVGSFLDRALKSINREILARSEADENCRGMGATVNYIQFAGGAIAIGHAGDSRTYLLRSWKRADGAIRFGMWCLTIDHNVGVFVERGLMIVGRDLPPGPLNERTKQRLMRGMGVGKDLKADLYCKELEEGDVFLTCSDGLHGYVTDKVILKTLVAGPLAQAPERLISLAHSVGAPDNVTVVVSAVSSKEEPLLTPNEELIEAIPYYIRSPSGEFFGPHGAKAAVKLWIDGEFNLQAEVCGSLGEWIFLKDKEKLFKYYPEFNTQAAKDHYAYLSPESTVFQRVIKRKKPRPGSSKASKKPALNRSTAPYIFLALVAALIVLFYSTTARILLPVF